MCELKKRVRVHVREEKRRGDSLHVPRKLHAPLELGL